jgi:tRNA C32,U32 (ribose-2'-O)-methylase TrmJ
METVERVTESLLVWLVKCGSVAARSERLAEEKLRRMVRRFALDEADAEVFLGMVRKVREGIEKREGGK